MLILPSFIAGLFTDWWWLPLCGPWALELIHVVLSPIYRASIAHGKNVAVAAFASTLLSVVFSTAAFAAGHFLVRAF